MSVFIKSLSAVSRWKRSLSQKGQTLVEYALILAILTVIAIGVFSELGSHIIVIFSNLNSLLDTAQGNH